MKLTKDDIEAGFRDLKLDDAGTRAMLAKLGSPPYRQPHTPTEVITAPNTLASAEESQDAQLESSPE